jgi:putative oxidoreductase
MFRKLEDAYEYAPVFLRLGLAALFAYAGITKLMNPAQTTQFFGSLGFPSPEVFVWIAIVIELLGALFLLLGLLTRITAIVLTVFLCVAITTAYLIPWDVAKLPLLMNHWPMLGSTFALMFSGPGKWSLDEYFFWE